MLKLCLQKSQALFFSRLRTFHFTFLLFLFATLLLFQPSLSQAQKQVDMAQWPRGVTGVCRIFLNSCHRSCFRKQFRKYKGLNTPTELAGFCREDCWNHKMKGRICKLSSDQAAHVNLKLLQEASEQERAERFRLEEGRRKAQRQQVKEDKARRRRERKRRAKSRNIGSRERELREDIKDFRKSHQKGNNPSFGRAGKGRVEREAERKTDMHQKRLLAEERLRIAAEKKHLEESRRQAEKKKEDDRRRAAEAQRLREEQLQELKTLEKMREERARKIKAQRKLDQKEERLQKENARVRRLKRFVASEQKKRLARKQERIDRRRQRVKKKQEQLARQNARAAARRRTKMRHLARLRKKEREKARSRGPKKDPGKQLFSKGQFAAAKQSFSSRGMSKKAKKVDEFTTSYRKGRQGHKVRNPDGAIPHLERALTLYMEIAGSHGSYYLIIRKKLADMYISKGAFEFSRKQHAPSFVYFSAAKRYDSKSVYARSYLLRLKKIALGYYNTAIQKRQPSGEVSQLFLRRASKLLSRRDPLYKKIKKMLEA